ncbi:24962_t:CDS:2, partial [Gigaspora rosea]
DEGRTILTQIKENDRNEKIICRHIETHVSNAQGAGWVPGPQENVLYDLHPAGRGGAAR